MAYGYLKGETGMHRLVRISPFNAEGKRQTSFAAVDVSPEIAEDAEIELRDEDIREDVFRASGAGGQHVNKTSSAIRLTHFPSGIVVQCQNERSQHKNRATAIKMLALAWLGCEEEKREAEQATKYKSQAKTGFGSQIRNYFLHPDQRVKDQRTGHYVGSFQSVLDGNIQGFLDAYLQWRVGKTAAKAVLKRRTGTMNNIVLAASDELRVVFDNRVDRWGHTIEVRREDQWIVAYSSIEGTSSDDWPPSPAFQHIHLQTFSLNGPTASWSVKPARATGRQRSRPIAKQAPSASTSPAALATSLLSWEAVIREPTNRRNLLSRSRESTWQ